jgi:hypothetical protein
MKQLFLKDLREQAGVMVLGVFVALMTILLFRLKSDPSTDPLVLGDRTVALDHLFLILFIVYAAAFSNAIAGDRDRGNQAFLAALPLHPFLIWLVKIAAAVTALAVIHAFIASAGLLFGYPHLTLFLTLVGLPQLILFVLILSGCCTLLCGTLFKRAFSILIASGLLIFCLTFTSALIRFFWQWPGMMAWPLAAGCTGMIIASILSYIDELRGGFLRRKRSWAVALGIFSVMLIALHLQYRHEICRITDLRQAEIVEWLPGSEHLLVAASQEGPLFLLAPDNGQPRKISRRFETFDRDEISPDSRFIVLYDHRGWLGSYSFSDMLMLMNDREFHDPSRPIANWIWRDSQDSMIPGFGSSIIILDIRTGHRTTIGESLHGRPVRATWYDHANQLAVLYFKKSGNEQPGTSSIALMQTDGTFLRYLVHPEERGFITVTDDRSTLVSVTLHDPGGENQPRISTRYKTVLDDDWISAADLGAVPSVSPDHQWILRFQVQPDVKNRSMILEGPGSVSIPAGVTRTTELARWSPGSRTLVFSRDRNLSALQNLSPEQEPVADTGIRELVVFDTETLTLTPLPEDASDVFSRQFASWSAQILFAPDESRFAAAGHSPEATPIIYPTPGGFYLVPDSRINGWLDSCALLLHTYPPDHPNPEARSLHVLDIRTGQMHPFIHVPSAPKGGC